MNNIKKDIFKKDESEPKQKLPRSTEKKTSNRPSSPYSSKIWRILSAVLTGTVDFSTTIFGPAWTEAMVLATDSTADRSREMPVEL